MLNSLRKVNRTDQRKNMTRETLMRAIAIGPDKTPASLFITEVAIPEPKTDEILVRIHAAGVNRGDCYQRMGFYPPPPGASEIMGLEFSGEVVATGSSAKKWKIGDRVAALVAGGGYAEYACVHQDHALAIPADMDYVAAASLPETVFTVWANVFEHAYLDTGETLLIHGGSSGIGVTAIQMAKLRGATVFVTAGSDEKCAACLALGADSAINYRNRDFVEDIQDMVGGDYVARNIAASARAGRIVNIAFLNGSKVEVDLMPVMLKNLTLTGSTLRARSIDEKTRLTDEVAREIWPHVGETIGSVVDSVFPLAEAGKAHAKMETSAHIGKIILDCSA
jgi:NADPH2:quinone reductase